MHQPALALADMLVEVVLSAEERRQRELVRQAAWEELIALGYAEALPRSP